MPAQRATAAIAIDAGLSDAGADADAGPQLAALDEIAARGAIAAAGLREVAREEAVLTARGRFAATDRDACVRVVFAADEPVRVTLRDATGTVLGDEVRAREGAAPARGPACVRAGQSLDIVLEGTGRVRYVTFASP